jgi:MFS family permease
MEDINETDPTLGALQIGIFLFAFGVAPLVLAPLSEVFGRRVVLSGGNVVFIAFGVGSGFCNTVKKPPSSSAPPFPSFPLPAWPGY